MKQYTSRYSKLNPTQQKAVDSIDGPLLVLAGPGTGKTELLSMRAANILQKTDTLPSNILCLTFTDSGAAAMRERLASIVGPDAYKVAIHTFHSFGAEVINQNAEYFYRGAEFRPADELAQYEILREIFDKLDYTNPLAGMNGDEYTHLRDARTAISELKKSSLTHEELLKILESNTMAMDAVEPHLDDIFATRINKQTVHLLGPLAKKAASVPQSSLPIAITPYANTLALSIAHAVDASLATDSTKPITAWKEQWCEKNDRGKFVFRDRKRGSKLQSLASIYHNYLRAMDEAKLYDFDDMIMQVVHAIETQNDLLANLQEKYQYVMIDEFQDTNLAQLRIALDLMPTSDSNLMVVGDDDQAIFSFQGADIGNIQRFRAHFADPEIIVLKDNYRSAAPILDAARSVITLGQDRLENSVEELDKLLEPHAKPNQSSAEVHSFSDSQTERAELARMVAADIKNGAPAAQIAILARTHSELVGLLPYLHAEDVPVNYERRDDVMQHDIVQIIEYLLMIVDALHRDAHDEASSLLPEILSHPAFGYDPHDIWKLSLASWRDKQLWLEVMSTTPVFKPFADWLIIRTAAIHTESLEQQIDNLLGREVPTDDPSSDGFVSPLYGYFFSAAKRAEQPTVYLEALEALRTIRDRLHEHFGHEEPTVSGFLEFLQMHRELGTGITAVRRRSSSGVGMVNLLTAHKSKGLEFEHVYVCGAVDSAWGERVRSRSRLIAWTANLPLAPVGASYDERLRLFYVAMTRARAHLTITYSLADMHGKPTYAASFLLDSPLASTVHEAASDLAELTARAEIDWRTRLTSSVSPDMRSLLTDVLDSYKLSATHLGNFLDVSRGGPQHFLLNNLLRFPSAKSAHASYGTAIHATLQRAHDFFRAKGRMRPIEDILGEYERILRDQHLNPSDYDTFLARGIDALSVFLDARYDTFKATQATELSFGGQQVMCGDARLTGALDLVNIDKTEKTILVTDYKTGKPSRDWRGKTDYERIKLHKYRQQLMFYQLLVENSRDFSKYHFAGGVLQFVEPTPGGDIVALEQSFTPTELDEFRQLIAAVWRCITTLDLPDVSEYEPTYKGMLQFEALLIDKTP